MTERRRATRPRRRRAGDRTAREARLLERERERSLLRATLASARRGEGALVGIAAAAGLGKSQLLAWAVEHAHARDMRVLEARSGEAERDFSLGVVLQLFEPWLAAAEERERRRVLGGAATLALPLFGGEHWGQAQAQGESPLQPLLHGLFWLTANLAASDPVLIAVDDLHWTDPASIQFLLYLAHRLSDLPVAMLLTWRPQEQGAGRFNQLIHHPSLALLRPAPLTAGAVARVLRSGFKTTPAPKFSAACLSATGGNPFLVHAVVRALTAEGVEPTEANAPRVLALKSEDIRREVVVRMAWLGRDARELAAAVAVLGDRTSLGHAAMLAGLEPAAAAAAADELASADVLAQGLPLSFSHPLVRTAVYDELPAAQRSQMHLRAARILHEDHAGTERLGAQLLLAPPTAEAWVTDSLRQVAAHALSRGSPEAAVQYLTRALEERMPDSSRGEILLDLGRAETMIGEGRAERHLEQALRLVDVARCSEVYNALGSLRYLQGRYSAAADAFGQGIRWIDDPTSALGRELHAGYYSAASVDRSMAKDALAHLAPLLERGPAGEPVGPRSALAALAIDRCMAGAPRSEVSDLAQRAWANGRLLLDAPGERWAWSLVTAAFSATDELDRADEVTSTLLEQARRSGSLMTYATASYCAAMPAFLAGRISEARAHVEAALEVIAHGWQAYTSTAYAVYAEILVASDELDAAGAALTFVDDPRYQGYSYHAIAYGARARLRLLRGQNEEALADFLTAGGLLQGVSVNPAVVAWRSGAAIALDRLGDLTRANELIREEAAISSATETPTNIARTLRAQARMLDGPEKVTLLEQALRALENSPARLSHLQTLADLGTALRIAGARTNARRYLEQAVDVAHRSGARLIERQVHDELRVAGARPRRLMFSGVDALTAGERRVVEMAAQKMTNKEIAQALFVTSRAVEKHLYNAYRKLGITSRQQLRTVLDEGSSN